VHTDISTNFARTYFSTDVEDLKKINALLQKFWEVDTSGTKEVSLLTHEDEIALRNVYYIQGKSL